MEAIGPILVVLSIPLMLRWVPQNPLYGLRIPATLHDESVWYDANASHGRHVLVLGLLMVGLEFVLPSSARTSVLATVGIVGLAAVVLVDLAQGQLSAARASGACHLALIAGHMCSRRRQCGESTANMKPASALSSH